MKRDATKEQRQKQSERVKSKWNDPIWRAQMIEKQTKAGLRSYGVNLSGKVIR